MSIKKLALTLAGLVIVGLLIFAVISIIIPNTMEVATCYFKAILNPSGSSTSLSSCSNLINFRLK